MTDFFVLLVIVEMMLMVVLGAGVGLFSPLFRLVTGDCNFPESYSYPCLRT